MRYHTKEYYRLLMALDSAELYEPTVDKEKYSDEDIEEMYQRAMDRYIEEERADYDAPPEYMIDEEDFGGADSGELIKLRDSIYAIEVEAYENRPPFDEEEARADFEEMYKDSLEEPDECLPEWVKKAVDPRVLAMGLMPEKIYRKLAAEDEKNQERFDVLDDAADEACEKRMKELPQEFRDFTEMLEDLEDSYVVSLGMKKAASEGEEYLEIVMIDWNDHGEEEARTLRFAKPEFTEDEGIRVKAWEDEDGDSESDCEFLYGELYLENGRPELHMMFDNNGLKYLTFRCEEATAEYGENHEECRIGTVSQR